MTDHPFPPRYRPENHQWDLPSTLNMLDWNIKMLTKLRDELPGTWARALDWTPGVSAGGDVSVSGGRVGDDGAENGRVPNMALARLTERSSGPAVDFHIILEGMVRNSRVNMRVHAAQQRLRVAEPAPDVLEPKRAAGSGTCGNPNCGWVCAGGRDDRIRRGRCPRCAAYLAKHNIERPHEVCHTVEVDGCRQCLRDAAIESGASPEETVYLVDGRAS